MSQSEIATSSIILAVDQDCNLYVINGTFSNNMVHSGVITSCIEALYQLVTIVCFFLMMHPCTEEQYNKFTTDPFTFMTANLEIIQRIEVELFK